jgi:hypothetical protein
MQYRTPGRTRVKVSTLAPSTMNFGAIGHTTQADATAIVDAALEAGTGWLSGAIRAGQDITTSRSNFMPQRLDTSIPPNRAKLDAVEQLAAGDIALPAQNLDQIDQIVAPGVDLAADEEFDTPPSLLDPALRRRR